MNKVYDDFTIELWHGDGLDLSRDLLAAIGAIIVTDPPIEIGRPFPDEAPAHLIVHPHFFERYPDPPLHVSAWIRHSPGIVRDGFGHHWNAVLHYGPADLPTDLFIDDAPRETDHPAERGVGPMTDLLSALPDGVILDPFAGTGSTLLAARALGRRAVGIELDERWVEVACARLRR